MKLSKRKQEIEARRAADPIAQALGRTDIDYESDELPAAPRATLRQNEATKLDNVNSVIMVHMFPQCVKDSRAAVHFEGWEFSGFAPDPSSTILLRGIVGASHKKDGQFYSQPVVVDVIMLSYPETQMFSHIDHRLMFAIQNLISSVTGETS